MTAAKPLNIVYMHSHDTGREVQPYGAAARTPSMQRLAEEGILFRQAFSAAPTCSPSRAALLTGQNPHSSGMLGLAHRGFSLHDPRQHLAHTLREAGYETVLAGMQHVTSDDPATVGYSRDLRAGHDDASRVAPRAAEYILEHANQRPEIPLFLDVGFFEAHRPFQPADAGRARYVRPISPLPDAPATRTDTVEFLQSVEELDNAYGLILEALDESGLAESTLVICTTDHGPPFPMMKCNLNDRGIGVLLIMRGPGGLAGGQVIDAMVSQIDLYPTICEMVAIDQPDWLRGTSMMPLIRGELDAIRDELFSEVTYHAAYEPMRAIRTDRWSYIRRFGGRTKRVLPNCDGGQAKDFLFANGWGEQEVDPEQLFDNRIDANQGSNLIGRPEVESIENDLRGRLEQWMRETNDPLLHGEVPLPPGATMNDVDSLSPDDFVWRAKEDGSLERIENPGIHR